MNHLDIVILVILSFFVFKGLTKGLIKEIAGLIGFSTAFILATSQLQKGAAVFKQLFNMSDTAAFILSYVSIFFIVLFAVRFIAKIIVDVFKKAELGWLDKVLGAVFGFVFGVLIICSAYFFISMLPFSDSVFKGRENSLLFSTVEKVTPKVINVLMSNMNFDEIMKIGERVKTSVQ